MSGARRLPSHDCRHVLLGRRKQRRGGLWHTRLCLAAVLFANILLVAAAQCPGGEVSTLVGGQDQVVSGVPALLEGASYRRSCDSLVPGYEGFVDVLCIGGRLVARSHRCSPAGCLAGQQAPARFTVANATVFVSSSRPVEHGKEEYVPCRGFFAQSYEGHIRLVCRLGQLEADPSECKPTFVEPSSVWRMINVDPVSTSFRVFELGFFTNANCRDGRLFGQYVASNEDSFGGDVVTNAFDGDVTTAWASRCPNGCDPSTAWIGVKTLPSDRVRCVRFLQSSVACCTSRRVRLEVWHGSGWQTMHEWDTVAEEARSEDPTDGLSLSVPITCDLGKPNDLVGIRHDCDGPPIVGKQAGDICYARCEDGYYGEASLFECRSDGSFVGTPPTCYEIEPITRLVALVILVFFAWFSAQQYQFWCMQKKVRLRPGLSIPEAMRHRWLEQDGVDVWEKIAKEKAEGHVVVAEGDDEEEDDELGIESFPDASEQKSAGPPVKRVGAVNADTTASKSHQLASMVSEVRRERGEGKRRGQTIVHGLCSVCEDPEVCWAFVCCPVCRIADTWHTLGRPTWLTYWRVVLMYYCLPCCWPCFNYYGRHRIRTIFQIPLEPHRDCCIHCCCCCCCMPCAACQEARLVDAPSLYYQCRKKVLMGIPTQPGHLHAYGHLHAQESMNSLNSGLG